MRDGASYHALFVELPHHPIGTHPADYGRGLPWERAVSAAGLRGLDQGSDLGGDSFNCFVIERCRCLDDEGRDTDAFPLDHQFREPFRCGQIDGVVIPNAVIGVIPDAVIEPVRFPLGTKEGQGFGFGVPNDWVDDGRPFDIGGVASDLFASLLEHLVVCRGFSDPVECGSASADFGDDFFGGLVPDERFRVLVPVLSPHFDGVDELVDAGEAAAA